MSWATGVSGSPAGAAVAGSPAVMAIVTPRVADRQALEKPRIGVFFGMMLLECMSDNAVRRHRRTSKKLRDEHHNTPVCEKKVARNTLRFISFNE